MSVILITSLLAATTLSPLEGVASWYDYRPNEAAAGPALREYLGKDWRGQTVEVWSGDKHVSVVLTDWCQCFKGTDRERVIDLDIRSFAQLAHASKGILKVEVRSAEKQEVVHSPSTIPSTPNPHPVRRPGHWAL